MSAKKISQAAIIAALYIVLTYAANLFGLANNPVQIRLSEALCILPYFTASAVPGLFVGCFLANLLTGCAFYDVLFGSLATLLGALGSYWLRKKRKLVALPPILSNTIIVPLVLRYVYAFEGSIPYFMLTVGLGEILSCGVLGMLLLLALEKRADSLFE